MRLTDDYQYLSEEEQQTSKKLDKKEQQTSKNLTRKAYPKNQQKIICVNLINGFNKKETGTNRELFKKHFSFQRPRDVLKTIYNTNDRNKTMI